MTERTIIGLASWLDTPAGHYLREWEQAQLDHAVADIFGFHALQLGLGAIDGLRANRMPHRWLALDGTATAPASGRIAAADAPGPDSDTASDGPPLGTPAFDTTPTPLAVRCDFDALPFATRSLDLIVLPHALEFARDPHRALAEVDRVLRPEGRLVIAGFNPASLWGLRQRAGRLRRRLRPGGARQLFLPGEGDLIGWRRLRDWLRLLSFEVEASRFGGYGWPLNRDGWIRRDNWIERAGDRWWSPFGALYVLVAVKRVRGMRLVGMVKSARAAPATAPAVVVRRSEDPR